LGQLFHIDTVLIKLESMEKNKSKKKADLNKMFDIWGGEGEDFDADGDGVISKEEFESGMRPGTSGGEV